MSPKALSAAVLCAAVVLGLAGLAAPAATAAPAVKSDFNGDGFPDLAVGVPGGTADGRTRAGFVHVLWGSPDGLGGSSSKISQASSGIPGTAEAGDRFGYAVQAADLNGDSYADLAVTAPGEQIGSSAGDHEGAAYVLWGSARGLTSGLTVAKGVADQQLGKLVTAGDYDGDGDRDLVLSVQGEEGGATMLRPGPLTTQAPLSLVEGYDFGGARALTSADFDGDGTDDFAVTYKGMESSGTRVRTLASGSWQTTWHVSDSGTALASGDFNGDGRADLAIGEVQPDPEADGTYCEDRLGGAIATVYGAPGSTLGGKVTCTTQSSPYVGGTAEAEDNFGASLVVADLDGSGDDLLAGASHEAVGSAAEAGAFWEMEAGYDGVFTGPSFSQNSTGVAGTAEAGDHFGAALAAADYDGAAYGDLVIGAPGENASTSGSTTVSSGGVWYRPSAGDHPRLPAVSLTPAKLGLAGAPAYGGVLAR
ncbi:FG-GAP and VCBS repeat-containing protein [Streptomyces sp. 142MFCol3.1]|uniref:FG-GAP and VCBS repeat-containing protein n=1 Tax=Streptomyces sp. 142MFCol3.1 TaxID=1172179 RepID=UPI00048C13C2|nr:FG-GAP and VCBS repeat-containing protein [Streptomyces sp. 142MFCol3.1]